MVVIVPHFQHLFLLLCIIYGKVHFKTLNLSCVERECLTGQSDHFWTI